MNKINIYVLTFFLSLAGVSIYAQNNRSQVVITSGQDNNVFFHTIERGQTVYAIATMYGVTPDDIYRLNPDSKEGIKAGATLKIPQRDIVGGTAKKQDGNYIFHTIQPKETLYSLSIRYTVPATAIVKANPGLSTSTFTIGKTIRIPATQVEDLPTTELKTVTKEIEYTVQKKETMYRICRKFNISSYELIKLNPKLKEGVKAGMTIKIPVQAEENMTTEPATTMLSERDVNALLSEPKSIERVNSVKVALLLPFMTNEAIPSTETQRFIEYYEGFLLAVDNLIIGAVQNDQIGPVAEFAQKNNIKYVIPFTSKNDDVLSNAYVYQVNTPHSYLYAKAAQGGCDLFAEDNIILLNIRDGKDDSSIASQYSM